METNQRVLLALALSMAVLLGWSFFFAPKGPVNPPAPAAQSSQAGQAEQAAQPGKPAPAGDQGAKPAAAADTQVPDVAAPQADGPVATVKTPLYEARLLVQGGVLEHFVLERYKQTIQPDSPLVDLVSSSALAKAPMGLIWNGQPTWAKASWRLEGGDLDLPAGKSGTIALVGELPGLTIRRELTFQADSYLVQETVRLANTSAAQVQGKLAFTLACAPLAPAGDAYNHTRVEYLTPKDHPKVDSDKTLGEGVSYQGQLKWGGVLSNYFLLAMLPDAENPVFKARLVDGLYRVAVERDGLTVDPKGEAAVRMSYYLGPKVRDILSALPGELDKSISLGWFGFISLPLLGAMNWLNGYLGNYGVAIMVLTLLIKLAFWPLSASSYRSMNQMKKLQPMMEKIREKYADDRNKMNEEMMRLYQTYKVNPLGGCLPMVLQIPVFLGLYNALLSAIELRHAPFISKLPFTDLIWLADLSAKDPYYITPIIMGGTMLLQQRLTPAAGDPTQQKVMMFMPLIFTFMFLNFPAGLVLYWLVNNILSIAQQWWMTRES